MFTQQEKFQIFLVLPLNMVHAGVAENAAGESYNGQEMSSHTILAHLSLADDGCINVSGWLGPGRLCHELAITL